MTDTREQQIAQTTDRFLVVTANAGSGKTRALVNRYVQLLLEGADPREIVAITFTRKAAAEMLTRAAAIIDRKSKDKNAGPAELSKLRKIRERLTNARVSTIHSFCSNLLRDYPIEAGVDPSFSELSTADGVRIKRNAITQVMEEWLLDEDGPKGKKARRLFRAAGVRKVEEYIGLLISNSELARRFKEIYENGKGPTEKSVEAGVSKLVLPGLQAALNGLIAAIGAFPMEKLRKDRNDFYNNSALARDIVDRISFSDNEAPGGELVAILEDALKVCNFFYTASGGFRVKFGKALDQTSLIAAERYAKGFKIVKPALEALSNKDKDAELYAMAGALYEASRDAVKAIDDEKLALGCIDFTDMLTKALSLLEDRRMRKKIRKKIKFVLVDEFQDTNRLQYDIVRFLVPGLRDVRAAAEVNLFIVGDAKQSIYGFRNADVRVFKRAERDIAEVNKVLMAEGLLGRSFKGADGKPLSVSGVEAVGDVKLSASFRLQPVLAAFVNKVCGAAMNARESDYEVNYDPLTCARSVEALTGPDAENMLAQELLGVVEIILSGKKAEESEEVVNTSEDEALARHIKTIVESQAPATIQTDEGLRKAEYADIAVLARSRAGFDRLTAAFQKYRIPYTLHSGSGFFASQEIMDICSFLKFLHNQNDDIALAALLKSPFFGIGDTRLYEVSVETKGKSLWQNLSAYCAAADNNYIDGPEDRAFRPERRAYSMLQEMARSAPRSSIPSLILYILDETGWFGAIAGRPGKSRMAANAEKLAQLARDFEKSGFKNLYDFVEEIEILSEADASEGEAVVDANENAVNIMTIHASKGLEFPIVALYRSSFNRPAPSSAIVGEEYGLTFPLPINDPETGGRRNVETPLHFLNKNNARAAEAAEEKRLLYVALTRAKDRLIVSGAIDKKPKAYLEMIFNGLSVDYEGLVSLAAIDAELIVKENIDVLKDGKTGPVEIEFPLKIIREAEEIPFGAEAEKETPANQVFMLEELQGEIDAELYSATKFMSFRKDAEEFFFRYRYGLAAGEELERSLPLDSPETEKKDDAGPMAGTLIHNVMENVKYWLTADGVIIEEALENAVAAAARSVSGFVSDELTARALCECRSAASTVLLREAAERLQGSEAEKSLYMPVGGDFLTGSIDLLIKNKHGDMEIWDWKTNRAQSVADMKELAGGYEIQMRLYAYFLTLLFPEQKTFAARLLFTRRTVENAVDEEWTSVFVWDREELKAFRKEIENDMAALRKVLYGMKLHSAIGGNK